MIYPFFVVIYVWFMVEISKYVLSKILKSGMFVRIHECAILLSSIVLVFTFSDYHSFSQAISISEREYSSLVKDIKIFEFKKHPDHKNAALFVKKNMGPDDIIIAMDKHSYIYIGKTDYYLRTEGIIGFQMSHNYTLGVPIIHNLNMLKEIMQSGSKGNIWLITAHEHIGPHLKVPIMSKEVMGFLEQNNDKVIYTAEDGVTQVYLWKP